MAFVFLSKAPFSAQQSSYNSAGGPFCYRTRNKYRRNFVSRIAILRQRSVVESVSRENAVFAVGGISQKSPDGFEPCVSTTATSSKKYLGKKAVVVGAGPSGAVAAAFLAKQGFTVKVYERREDPVKEKYSRKRSNAIRLFGLTIDVMKEIGVELPSDGHRNGVWKMKGFANLDRFGSQSTDQTSRTGPEAYYGMRNCISEILTEDVQKIYSKKVTFIYKHKCTDITFDDRCATFEDNKGEVTTESYDLLIAADGVNSVVRQKLQEHDPTFRVKTFINKWLHKTIRHAPLAGEQEELLKHLSSGWVVVAKPKNSRKAKTTSGFQCLVSFHPSEKNKPLSLTVEVLSETFEEEIKDREYEWMKEWASDIFSEQWIKEFSLKLARAPVSKGSDTCQVSSLVGPATILVGDAGHSAGAYGGMGANLAIVDSKVLYGALEDADGDIDAAAKIFNERRFNRVRSFQDWQLTAEYELMKLPFPENWRYFVGWANLAVLGSFRRYFPNWKAPPVGAVAEDGEFTPEKVMQRMKRDAAIVLVILVSAVSLPLLYAFA